MWDPLVVTNEPFSCEAVTTTRVSPRRDGRLDSETSANLYALLLARRLDRVLSLCCRYT